MESKLFKKVGHLVFRDVTSLGGLVFYGLVLLLVLSLGEINLFLKLLFGFVFVHIVVILIKSFYFKERPKRQEYFNYLEKLDAASFPSAHASRITVLAFILIYFFGVIYVKILLGIVALAVLYSRVYLKKHYWIDLIGGMIIGALGFWLAGVFL